MKIPKNTLSSCLTTLLILLGIPSAWAVRPLYSPFAVVAGCKFTPGFKDGSFNTALFNQPLGLTLSEDGTRLFVADSLNNRIRVIHLDQKNEVGTIAGQASAGSLDGPLTLAQFHEPRGVLYLQDGFLAVNDFGNQSLRFVDMKRGMVTTYRGGPVHLDGSDSPNPNATPSPNAKPPVLLNGIKDMAYLPAANMVLFTQPNDGVLNALNLGTGKITAIMKDNAQIPHPSALWIQEKKIYVADLDSPIVFSMDLNNNAVTNMQPAGRALDKLLSLSFSGQNLYGLLERNGYPVERFLLSNSPDNPLDNENQGILRLNNGWGDYVPPDKYNSESIQPNSPWVGLVPDPSNKEQFFYSIPNLNIIVTVRDLFGEGKDRFGIANHQYPAQKPKNTYRILLCGDCRVTDTDDFIFPTVTHPVATGRISVMPPNISIASQVEHALNFRAALDDNPMNYEFINVGHHGDLMFWPTTDVPDKAKKLDADLVIIFSPIQEGSAFFYYFLYNLTSDGIPKSPPDPEYVLKPPLERIPDGLPRKFYDYCKAHNLVTVQGNKLDWSADVYTDPNLHDMMLEFWGKPWEVLKRKLSNIRTSSGKPVELLILFACAGPQSTANCKSDLLKEVALKYGIRFFDLDPYLNALDLSYFPMTGPGHFDPNGALFFGKLLAHVLPNENLIPWPTAEKTPTK
jgi:hypothetical protein